MTHKMIVHNAKEFAGVFYDNSRSSKFRATWPDQMDYVNRNWERFVVHVRKTFAEMLTRNDVPQRVKDEIYEAMITDAPGAHSMRADEPLQVAPNTQGFEGDKKENRLTDDVYGKTPSDLVRNTLMTTTSRRVH